MLHPNTQHCIAPAERSILADISARLAAGGVNGGRNIRASGIASSRWCLPERLLRWWGWHISPIPTMRAGMCMARAAKRRAPSSNERRQVIFPDVHRRFHSIAVYGRFSVSFLVNTSRAAGKRENVRCFTTASAGKPVRDRETLRARTRGTGRGTRRCPVPRRSRSERATSFARRGSLRNMPCMRGRPRRPERAYMDILKNATPTIPRCHTLRWMTTFPNADMNLTDLVTRCPSCPPWPCRRFRVRSSSRGRFPLATGPWSADA